MHKNIGRKNSLIVESSQNKKFLRVYGTSQE